MAQTLYKKPNEEIYFSMSFAKQLDGTEVINSVPSFYTNKISPEAGLNLVIDTPTINSPANRVTFKLAGGTLNILYEVTILVRTSDNNLLQGDGFLEVVKNPPC